MEERWRSGRRRSCVVVGGMLILLGWMGPALVQASEPSPGWPPVFKRMQECQARMKGLKDFADRLEEVRGFHREVEAQAATHRDPMVDLFWVYLDMVAATPSRAACKDTEEEIRFAAMSPTREMEGLPKSAAWALDLLHALCR